MRCSALADWLECVAMRIPRRRSRCCASYTDGRMKLDEFMGAVTPAKRRSKLTPYLADMRELREQGYTLAQVCDFLARNGVTTSPSNVASYLHRTMARTPQPTAPASTGVNVGPKGAAAAPSPAADAATEPPAPPSGQFEYGSHDPRRIDEVLRKPPDMVALVKQGRAAARDKRSP